MGTEEIFVQLIFGSIDRINEQLPQSDRIAKSEATILMGEGSDLESLTLVTLLVDIEDAVESRSFGRIDILNEGVSGQNGPAFASVIELAKWIQSKAATNV